MDWKSFCIGGCSIALAILLPLTGGADIAATLVIGGVGTAISSDFKSYVGGIFSTMAAMILGAAAISDRSADQEALPNDVEPTPAETIETSSLRAPSALDNVVPLQGSFAEADMAAMIRPMETAVSRTAPTVLKCG